MWFPGLCDKALKETPPVRKAVIDPHPYVFVEPELSRRDIERSVRKRAVRIQGSRIL